MMFFKESKKLTQEDQNKINLAKKIQSKLPEDLIENDKENKTNQSSNKYKIHRNIMEEADFNIDHYIQNNHLIYKAIFILIVLHVIIITMSSVTLFMKPDTKFFATSPDGRVWELNTRENPNGNFVIKEYKGR